MMLATMPANLLANDEQVPQLKSNKDTSSDGFFKLSWQEEIGPVEIQEATSIDFIDAELIQPGSDSATVISGKPDGNWHYRARRVLENRTTAWSDPITVTVQHHSLERALFFFFAGLMMFLATCWLVIRGERLE